MQRGLEPIFSGLQGAGPKEANARIAWQCFTTLFLSAEVHTRFHVACEAVGLPQAGSLKALLLLDTEDPPSMTEMADGLRCDASYITGLVDALESLGYVERRTMPSDRRVKRAHLTDSGRAARERALEIIAEPPKMLDRLTEDETANLARLMQKIADG